MADVEEGWQAIMGWAGYLGSVENMVEDWPILHQMLACVCTVPTCDKEARFPTRPEVRSDVI